MVEYLLFDKTRRYLKTVQPRVGHVELLNNRVSFAELTFDDDDPVLGSVENGSRVKVLVDGGTEADAEMGGPITERSGEGPSGSTKLRVEDDFRVFRNLGWPTPGSPIGSQTSEYKRYSGATETVTKNALADLSDLLGYGWTIPASTGLGSAQRVEFRFHPLVDKLVPLLDADGLSLTIRDDMVDVVQGALFPRVLTVNSGVIGDYSWKITAPTATRVVAGGEGEGTARLLQEFRDTAREAEWGYIAAVFKDARMAQGVTDLSPDGAEALAEGSGKASVTANLVETSWFRYGTYRVGDRVQVQVGPVEATETITQVVIDDTPENGVVIAPHLGAIEDDGDSRLAREVARLQARTRDLGSR